MFINIRVLRLRSTLEIIFKGRKVCSKKKRKKNKKKTEQSFRLRLVVTSINQPVALAPESI